MSTYAEQYASDTSGVPAMLDRLTGEVAVARSMVTDPSAAAQHMQVSKAADTLTAWSILLDVEGADTISTVLSSLRSLLADHAPKSASFDPSTGDALAGGIGVMRAMSDVAPWDLWVTVSAWEHVKAALKVSSKSKVSGAGGGTRVTNPDNPLAAALGFRVEVRRDGKVLAGTGTVNANSLLDATRKALGKNGHAIDAGRLTRGDMAHKSLRSAIDKVMSGEGEVVDVGYCGLIVMKVSQAGRVAA